MENSLKKLIKYYQVCMDTIVKEVNKKAQTVDEKFSKKELDEMFKELFYRETGFKVRTTQSTYEVLSNYVEFCIAFSIEKFNIPGEYFNKPLTNNSTTT